MAKSTRFATTVTTRNLITPQGVDGFFLDGRASGARDARGVDSTLDREDRGFFYALYSNAGADVNQIAQRNQKHLNKIFQEMKTANRNNIDQEINELADCAVNIAGRLTISDSQQAPYFTGVVVKDGELAAITSGRGCAYLYRNDILYPLTKDEYPLSAVNPQGESIKNLELYCAGLAGTIRYSNIAQLQPDDCFILTNKEVMETLGHHQILHILETCYDQHDAAQQVADEMAQRNPGATMQFMIGFVENITTLDKAGLKSLTGRMGWTQKSLSNLSGMGDGSTPATGVSEAAAAAAGGLAAGVAAGAAVSAHGQGYTQLNDQGLQTPAQPTNAQPMQPVQPVQPVPQATQPAPQPAQSMGEAAYYQQQNQGFYQQPYSQNQGMLGGLQVQEGMSLAKKIIIGVMIALIVILLGVLVYLMFFRNRGPATPVTTKPTVNRGAPTAVVSTKPKHSNSIFSSRLPSESKKPDTTKADTEPSKTQQGTQPANATPTRSVTTTTTKASGTPAGTTAKPNGTEYTVVEGDTVWGLAQKNANGADIDAYIKKIIAANKDKATADGENLNIFPGDKIIIPAP